MRRTVVGRIAFPHTKSRFIECRNVISTYGSWVVQKLEAAIGVSHYASVDRAVLHVFDFENTSRVLPADLLRYVDMLSASSTAVTPGSRLRANISLAGCICK